MPALHQPFLPKRLQIVLQPHDPGAKPLVAARHARAAVGQEGRSEELHVDIQHADRDGELGLCLGLVSGLKQELCQQVGRMDGLLLGDDPVLQVQDRLGIVVIEEAPDPPDPVFGSALGWGDLHPRRQRRRGWGGGMRFRQAEPLLSAWH